MEKNQIKKFRWAYRFQKIEIFVGAKTLAKNSYF